MSWINNWWQQVSGTAAQGLQITVVGMSLVFFTLGLIILVLALLTRLPGLQVRQKAQDQQIHPADSTPETEPTPDRATILSPTVNDAELAQVAAIAVALIRSQRATRQHARPKSTTSKWKQYGRAYQLGL